MKTTSVYPKTMDVDEYKSGKLLVLNNYSTDHWQIPSEFSFVHLWWPQGTNAMNMEILGGSNTKAKVIDTNMPIALLRAWLLLLPMNWGLELKDDSLEVITLISDPNEESPWVISGLIQDCLSLIQAFNRFKYNHVKCCSNLIVDHLAKSGKDYKALGCWSSVPPLWLEQDLSLDVTVLGQPSSF